MVIEENGEERKLSGKKEDTKFCVDKMLGGQRG